MVPTALLPLPSNSRAPCQQEQPPPSPACTPLCLRPKTGPCGSQVQVQLQGGHRPPPARGLAPDLWPRQLLTLSTLQPGKHPRVSPAHGPGTLPTGPSHSLAPRQPLGPWCLQHGRSQAVPGPGAALTPTSKPPEPSSLEQGERAPRTLHGQSAMLTSPQPGERAQPTAQDDLFDCTVLLPRGPGHKMATICLGPISLQPRLRGAGQHGAGRDTVEASVGPCIRTQHPRQQEGHQETQGLSATTVLPSTPA